MIVIKNFALPPQSQKRSYGLVPIVLSPSLINELRIDSWNKRALSTPMNDTPICLDLVFDDRHCQTFPELSMSFKSLLRLSVHILSKFISMDCFAHLARFWYRTVAAKERMIRPPHVTNVPMMRKSRS